MKLRQEQVVFLAALLVLGLLAWRELGSDPGRRRTSAQGDPAEPERFPAPDVAVALPRDEPHRPLGRNLLAPPSDVRPLPPLALVEPPRAELGALFPPPEPGPAPRAYGRLLRRDLAAAIDPAAAAELFAGAESELADVAYEDDEYAIFEEPARPIGDLIADAAEQAPDPTSELTAAERAQLVEGWKRQYDWFFDGVRTTFGRIENKDRFGLKTDEARANEALSFVEVLPEQGGLERFRGVPPISVPRETVQDWDFAATFANEIEVRRRRLGAGVSRGTFDAAMELAADCVRGRLEAPRALAIAEELYTLCAEFDANDPAPRLGLARCYEAGFDLDRAYAVYQDLLGRFGAHAEVHARLGLLEARFFLFERAEERLRGAVRVDRASWEAHWALGRFLQDRGRPSEALEHLEAADRAVPNDPSLLEERVAVRVDLAAARLALGEVAEARALFAHALSADPSHQRARAGWIATGLLAPEGGLNGTPPPPEETASEPGLELLLARGLAAIDAGDAVTAKAQLDAAAAADPLRANLAWRALSYLAEAAGQDGEAMRLIEAALECDPTDPWALYQAGRLRAREGDVAGARQAFLAALDRDLDFVDALAALGETAFEAGDFEDAERYLERAVALEPDRVVLHALRGLNHLQRGSVPEARASFERAREIEPSDPTARAGLAWCIYLSGDPEQAMVALRELDDALRDRPQDDPLRTWSLAQIDRIQDHLRKVEWSDAFERKERLGNQWDFREDAGPVHRLEEGELVLDGTFQKTGASTIFQRLPASLFVAAEVDVWIDPATKADVGLFLARESARRTATETIERVAVVHHHDRGLQVNLQKEGATARFVDMEEPFPTGRWVTLRIERTGDESDTRVTLYADGVPLIENFAMASLRANTELLVGILAEGEPGRAVAARFDDFRIVRREAL